MILYEYVDRRGWGVVSTWDLQRREQTRLDLKLDMLSRVSVETAMGMLDGVRGHGGLFKLKIRVQKVQLRPTLCYGPQNTDSELTLLMPAYERNFEWEPSNAPEIAMDRKQEVEHDPSCRIPYQTPSGQAH